MHDDPIGLGGGLALRAALTRLASLATLSREAGEGRDSGDIGCRWTPGMIEMCKPTQGLRLGYYLACLRQ